MSKLRLANETVEQFTGTLVVIERQAYDAQGVPRAPSDTGAQQKYEVLPANHILLAVPLGAGHHKLRMEYVPSGFAAGKWISVAAWLGLLGWAGALAMAGRRSHDARMIPRDAGFFPP